MWERYKERERVLLLLAVLSVRETDREERKGVREGEKERVCV